MNFSRRQKNNTLIGVNLFAFIIQFLKAFIFEVEVSLQIQIWLIALLPIVLLNIRWVDRLGYNELRHALLFLSTGAIIGLTIGGMLSTDYEMIWLEYLWLPLAIIAAIVHYSKSNKDEYTKA